MNTKGSIIVFAFFLGISAVLALLLALAPTSLPLAQSGTTDTQSFDGNQPIMAVLVSPPPITSGFPINTDLCIHDEFSNGNGGLLVNDQPGQKDLTRLCIDTTSDVSEIRVEFDWDDTGTSGANTMVGVIFFDTDGDGNANYMIFVDTQGEPATLKSYTFYDCPDDDSNIKCGGAVVHTPALAPSDLVCYVDSPVAKDPFASPPWSEAGDFYPNDAVGYCTIRRSVFPTFASVVNVCSIPGSVPSSVREDCIGVEGGGFLTIRKNELPDFNSYGWPFRVNNGTTDVCSSPFSITPTLPISGTSNSTGSHLCSVLPGTYAVTETVTSQGLYNLLYSECRRADGTMIGSYAGTSPIYATIAGFTLTSGSDVTCNFWNAAPTAAGLKSFDATPLKKAVQLDWTVDAGSIRGFVVYRDGAPLSDYIEADGSSAYQYLDSSVKKNKEYTYELQLFYVSGGTQMSDPVVSGLASPAKGSPKNK